MFFIFLLGLLGLSVGPISGLECFDDGDEFCIDQADILSVDLLPGSILFTEQNKNTSQNSKNATVDGSFRNAFDEMEFHRSKMNEYLCHGYMAEEIINVAIRAPRVKRKQDHPGDIALENATVHEKLLSDEGSSKYKNWLERTTTLDDVYRHYVPQKKLKKKMGVQTDENLEEFDGEVTGYAMQAPLPSGKVGIYEGPTGEGDHVMSSSGHSLHYGHPYGHLDHLHHEFFPTIHEEHYYHPSPPHEEEHHRPYHSKSKGHELSIRDFFEIALTALAFLAFGLFIIQLLMSATNTMNATMATMMPDGTQRFKRNTGGLPVSYASNEELNELSFRVLRSIEAALVAESDNGGCLRRILCEDNRESRHRLDGRKLWVPVWSLGMSWLSGRLTNGYPWSVMLNSVKAAILGLGGADCAAIFPKCDLKTERNRRRRRRRK